MKYSDARPLVEGVAEVEAASRECVRVNSDDTASQEDVIAAGEGYMRAIGKRNRAYDAACAAGEGPRAELGTGSGVVSETPHVPPGAQAEGTVEPGAAEKTREAGATPPPQAAEGEGTAAAAGAVQQPAGGAQSADPAAKDGQASGPVQTGEQVQKEGER